MACGAGPPDLATATTIIYFIEAVAFSSLTNHLPHSSTVFSVIRVRYPEGDGTLREVRHLATNREFILSKISIESDGYRRPHHAISGSDEAVAIVNVTLQVRGRA